MILCSKICFLNVLTQMLNVKQLVEATYYIPDSTSLEMKRGSSMSLTNQVKFNEYGQLVKQIGAVNTNKTLSSVEIYSYCPSLDPLAFTTSLLDGVETKHMTPAERYVSSLKKDSTLQAIYEWIIKQPPMNGNGERIIVYEHYESLWDFGHIIAEYLSTYFGFDIIYLDRIYNQYIRGEKKYYGNADNAQKTIQVCQDRELVSGVTRSMSGSYGGDETLNNLSVFLGCLKWNKLKRLYELMFPHEPLPPANYTESRLREILRGKLSECAGNILNNISPYSSLGVVPSEYEDAINDMDDLHYMY